MSTLYEAFDRVVDRKGTWSVKHDLAAANGYPSDVIPLWVADMDFRCPECVQEAIREAADHGIYGYSAPDEDFYGAVRGWFERRFGWETKSEWIVNTPGVVTALSVAVRAFSKPGDSIVIQTPVYYPFTNSIVNNGRVVAENPLIFKDGKYSMDLEGLEELIVRTNAVMMILCSPHNPIGRVWTKEELRALGEVLARHDVLLVSDEIHCDFVYAPNRHHIFAEAVPELADRTIVCTAPSKTFNLAGLQTSNIFIRNEELREAFKKEYSACGLFGVNLLGLRACKAAYEGGEEWLRALLAYLNGNREFIRDYVERELPGIELIKSQGTYFAWLDCRALGLSQEELDRKMIHEARLWLDSGTMFGGAGEGFQRLAYASPRSVIVEAMGRLKGML